jgi:hypothetical protein
MSRPILIIYPGGCYGTFIEWLLTYLTNPDTNDELPFGRAGNSHKFKGNQIGRKSQFLERATKYNTSGFARSHPYLWTEEQLTSLFSSTISISVPPTSTLWVLRNNIEKVYYDDYNEVEKKYLREYEADIVLRLKTYVGDNAEYRWASLFREYFDHAQLKAYNVNNVEDLKRWQLREIFSYWNIHKTIEAQHSSEHINNYHITVEDLRDQMPAVINKIIQKLKLNVVLDRHKKLDYIWQEWKSSQEYANMDAIVDEYIKNVISGIDQTVAIPFNICEEVVIQQKLREAGYEIKCDGLDHLPLRTIDLKELLYDV